jgi:ribokinase
MTTVALFVGDASLDLTLRIPRVPEPDEKIRVDAIAEAPGGVVTNAAVAASRAGARVRLLLNLGSDLASETFRKCLAAEGLSMEAGCGEGALCRATILLDRDGEKRLLLYPGQSMYPTLAQVESVDLANVGWVHTAAYDIAVAARLAVRCRAAGIPWSVDLEPATFALGIASLAPVLNGAATVFCNNRAADLLGGDPAGGLLDLGVLSVVATRGPAGAVLYRPDEMVAVAAPSVGLLDTTGAGDCLAGWFVAERLRGAAPADAIHLAVAAATFSCGRFGAHASFPLAEEMAAA